MVFGGGFYEEAIMCGHRADPIQIWHRLTLILLEKLGHRHAQGDDLQKTQRKEIFNPESVSSNQGQHLVRLRASQVVGK